MEAASLVWGLFDTMERRPEWTDVAAYCPRAVLTRGRKMYRPEGTATPRPMSALPVLHKSHRTSSIV